MALAELMAVVPPPEKPLNSGTSEEWAAAETVLGTRLPGDFREFCTRYGTGVFNDPGRLRIDIRNPLSPELHQIIRADRDMLFGLREELGRKYIPYPIFPEKGGLLLWAIDDIAGMLFWLTEGPPDEWP